MLYAARERFSALSAGIGKIFAGLGLSPNQLSLISVVLALITAWLIATQSFALAAVFLVIVSFWDLVDGAVARETRNVTFFGGYLDGVVDKYVEGIIAFGLLFVPLPAMWLPAFAWVFIYLFGEMLTTYAKAAAVEKGVAKKELRGGMLERPERTIILLMGIFLAIFSLWFLALVVLILAVLTNVTAFQRILIAQRISRRQSKTKQRK